MNAQQQQTTQTVTVDETPEAMLDRLLSRVQRVTGEIRMTATGVEFGNFEGVQRYARLLVDAGMVPTVKDDTPAHALARATAHNPRAVRWVNS